MIIKHKRCLSDREIAAQIQENTYLQYFVILTGYHIDAAFALALSVEISKRMGHCVFEVFQGAIIDTLEKAKKKSPSQTRYSTPEQQSGEACGYLCHMDQQYLPGDESAGPVEGLFALMIKGAAMVRLLLLLVGERLFYRQQAQSAIDSVLNQATAC